MTRPLGKSPARSKPVRPQLDVNPVSLIDVRAEDDSLLPGNGDASQQKKNLGPITPFRPVASPFKENGVKSLACIQEDHPECEDVQGIDGDEARDMLAPLATEEPATKKKKKKTGFNLRKSLAWNNAFFTEEGVLDPEELSLVNRTFKKLPEEPKSSSNKKPALTSKLMNPSTISKHFSPVRLQKPSMQAESRHHTAALGTYLKSTGNASKRTDLHNYGAKDFAASKQGVGGFSRVQADLNKHDKLMVSNRVESHGLKPLPLKKQIEENLRAASGPALSAAFSGPKPPLDRTKHTQSFASTLSSASKKMKDRLGMVFAGRTMHSTKTGIKSTAEDDAVVPSSNVTYYADSAKLTRCYSHSSYERFGRSTIASSSEPAISKVSNMNIESRAPNLQGVLSDKGSPSLASTTFSSSLEPRFSLQYSKEQTSASIFSHTQGISSFPRPTHLTALPDMSSISKETAGSEVVLSRAKPSGLRMPSPKLGFFDKPSRNIGATRLPIDVNGMGNTGKQSIAYGAIPPSIRNTGRQPTESATVNNYSKQPMLKPPVPFVNSSQMHYQAMGQSNTTNVLSGIPTASHLQPNESSSKPVTSSLQEPSSMSSGPCTTSSLLPSNLNALTLPGPSIIPARPALVIDGPSSNSSSTAGTQVSETSSEVTGTGSQLSETGVVLQVKKNAQNILPAVKRVVNHLNLSPLRIVKGQENLCMEQLKDRESYQHSPTKGGKACGNEDAHGALDTETQEEWPQVKSGAVQHSPPNKEPPKYGPWSPVRRNAPELGPFDCTKYTNPGISH